MYLKLILFFFSFLFLSQIVLADSATLNNGGTTTSQQAIDGNDEFLTVTNNSTLNTGATKPANITGDTVSVTVDSGSTITSNKGISSFSFFPISIATCFNSRYYCDDCSDLRNNKKTYPILLSMKKFKKEDKILFNNLLSNLNKTSYLSIIP